MKDRIVNFTVARLAKIKGFQVPCNIYYDDDGYQNDTYSHVYMSNEEIKSYNNINCTAPTLHILHKWLREKHGIYILVIPTVTAHWTYKSINVLSERDNDILSGVKSVSDLPPYEEVCGYDFSSYEDALEDGLYNGLMECDNPKSK